MSKSRGSDHIDDMVEWGQKQYTPWEYAQKGKLPPVIKAKGNKKRAAILFFIQGIVCTIVVVLVLINNQDSEQGWLQLLIPAVFAVLCFMAAVNYLRQWKTIELKKEKERSKRKKKKSR